MTARAHVEFTVPAEVRQEGTFFVAGCPARPILRPEHRHAALRPREIGLGQHSAAAPGPP